MDLVSVYLGVIAVGALHGLEPGHGWPLAFLYSTRRERPLFCGLITSSILAFFHFLSSIVVVVAYLIIASFVSFSFSFLNYLAAVVLVLLAIVFWREKVEDELEAQHGHMHGNKDSFEHTHDHEHPNGERHTHRHKHTKSITLSLGALAVYAFILGFAHEEEFALLALIAAGADPWILMLSYAFAVSASLITITLLCIRLYRSFLQRLQKYQKYIPKISAIILLGMAVGFLFQAA